MDWLNSVPARLGNIAINLVSQGCLIGMGSDHKFPVYGAILIALMMLEDADAA